jgi:hypothetical protein
VFESGEFHLSSLMLSPELYPIAIDRLRHRVSFVPMSPDRYRSASFSDLATAGTAATAYTFNLDDLLLYGIHIPNHAVPVHYVFHTAYCCSTLLARYLDLIPPCFVLREPSLLAQIATLRPSGNPKPNLAHNAATEEEWQELMKLALRLLTRTYTPANVVVIKVNDLCNSLGSELLLTDARSRIVFLYVSLSTFILSVLKRQSRRVWLRRRLRDTRKAAESVPELARIDPAKLRDAEGAAYLWLLNKTHYDNLRRGDHSARVFACDGERVAESPEIAIADIAAFFGLPLSQQGLSQLLAHPFVGRYSKDQSVQYDAESRRHDLAEMQSRFGVETEKGVEWAYGIKQEIEFEEPR